MTCTCLASLVLAATLAGARPQEEDPAPRQHLTELSLEELAEVKVTVSLASLFDESELLLGSTALTGGRRGRNHGHGLYDVPGLSPFVLRADTKRG